jgi:thioredoxin-related protein
MMNVVIAAVIVVVVGVVALTVRRRQRSDVPTQKIFTVPAQIDRSDFDLGTTPEVGPEWLLVLFTSSACHVCADVWDKARVMSSRHVGVFKVDYESQRELHQRYGIDAVPTVVICDRDGVVQYHFLGPMSATDLWAAVATVRDPPSRPDGTDTQCQHS